jgi:hypothetical protein
MWDLRRIRSGITSSKRSGDGFRMVWSDESRDSDPLALRQFAADFAGGSPLASRRGVEAGQPAGAADGGAGAAEDGAGAADVLAEGAGAVAEGADAVGGAAAAPDQSLAIEDRMDGALGGPPWTSPSRRLTGRAGGSCERPDGASRHARIRACIHLSRPSRSNVLTRTSYRGIRSGPRCAYQEPRHCRSSRRRHYTRAHQD